jgi:hypothetical protein
MLNTSLPCNSVTAIVAANRFNEVCYVSRDRIFRGHGQPAQPLYASRYSAVVCWLSRPEAPANRHAVRDGDDVYLVASLITVASDWVVSATLVGRWLALALLSLAALGLIFPSFAQRVAGPALRLGNAINSRSTRTRGTASALLAGLAVGLLWSPCAGPVLGPFSV